jgi:uncharacterized protein YndB with AHSA1/START domain
VASEPVVRQVFIDAPPEEIFPYLTQADKFVLWMGLSAQIEARPGGMFRVDPNNRDAMLGEFVEVTPFRRIVFTWGWEAPGHAMPAGSSRVEIELTPREGGTLLTLTHRNLPDDSREEHDRGWSHYLKRLAIATADAIDGFALGPPAPTGGQARA